MSHGFLRIVSVAAASLLLGIATAIALEMGVRDAQTGQPVAGATVRFWTAMGGEAKVSTDSSGRAQSPTETPEATLSVTVEKQGFAPMAKTWAEGKLPSSFEFLLSAAQPISGRVVDQGGQPVAGVQIEVNIPQRLAGPDVPRSALVVKSDADGKWRCDAVPKDATYITVEASHPDYEAPANDVSLETLHAGTALVKMTRVATVAGLVLDQAGQSEGGADVVLGPAQAIWPGNATLETKSDDAGRFEFRRVRLEKRLLGVKADHGVPFLRSIEVTVSMTPIEVKLARGTPLGFRVVDQAGQPIPGVIARVDEWPADVNMPTPEGAGRWSFPGWEWRTDPNGRFTWTNAPAQAAAWTLSKVGYMSQGRVVIKPGGAEQAMTLGPAFSLIGTVTDHKTSQPVPAFIVTARFVQINAFGSNASTNFGSWDENNRKPFTGGQFKVYYENPLLIGTSQMHAWQFRVEADDYAPAISRVIRDEERGTNLEFLLEPISLPEISVPGPTGTNRVTAGAIFQPASAAPGNAVTVMVKVRTAPGCWIYGLENSGSGNLPTALVTPSPWVLRATGPWRGPEPKVKDDGSRTYSGDVQFQRGFVIERGTMDATTKLPITLNYQVCNEALCWPPSTIYLEPSLKIVRSR